MNKLATEDLFMATFQGALGFAVSLVLAAAGGGEVGGMGARD
jgi:hypothetical protein